jgi:hypothetical protein
MNIRVAFTAIPWDLLIAQIMVALNLGEFVAKAIKGDLRMGVYWLAAAALNYSAAGFPLPRLPWAR